MSEPPRQMDRFGWYQSDHVDSPEEKALSKIDESKEGEREIKWAQMTSSPKEWNKWMSSKRNKVAERIKKGIPDSMRSRAWALISNVGRLKAEATVPFSELMIRSDPPLEGYITIDKDLSRTFPQIGFFSQPGFIESLRHVLYAYCKADSELGYTQGMSFIAGMFLTYMDEESAYYALYNVMNGTRTMHRDYFIVGFPRLTLCTRMLSSLMRRKCPRLLDRLNQLDIMLEIFTTGWFMPAFQSYSWVPQLQLRLFERFLFYGTRALLSYGLVIILRHKQLIMTGNMETVLTTLHHPDESPQMQEWHMILADWDKNWINKKTYLALLKEQKAPPEPLD